MFIDEIMFLNPPKIALMFMDGLTPLQKARLEKTRHGQLFAVVSWGCAATRWLAKVLNCHPEILCLHHGIGAVASFHSSMDSLKYFRVLSMLGHEVQGSGRRAWFAEDRDIRN